MVTAVLKLDELIQYPAECSFRPVPRKRGLQNLGRRLDLAVASGGYGYAARRETLQIQLRNNIETLARDFVNCREPNFNEKKERLKNL